MILSAPFYLRCFNLLRQICRLRRARDYAAAGAFFDWFGDGFTTFPAFRQRVQIRMRTTRVPTWARTYCRFGRNRRLKRFVTRRPMPPFFLAIPRRVTWLPMRGRLPQVSQTLVIGFNVSWDAGSPAQKGRRH